MAEPTISSEPRDIPLASLGAADAPEAPTLAILDLGSSAEGMIGAFCDPNDPDCELPAAPQPPDAPPA